MRKFTNPLNNIKIASPCAANWNEMYGDERTRHCAECKLNVYNLSEMTQSEAENFLVKAEGRVCLKVYRRTDGTVLTKDCPVGWRKLKKRVSTLASAGFAVFLGFFGGVLSLQSLKSLRAFTNYEKVPEVFLHSTDNSNYSGSEDDAPSFGIYGIMENLPQIKIEIFKAGKF